MWQFCCCAAYNCGGASAWSGVEVKDAPASWRDCVEGGAARMAYTRYADVVPTAYLEYDWTDLLP